MPAIRPIMTNFLQISSKPFSVSTTKNAKHKKAMTKLRLLHNVHNISEIASLFSLQILSGVNDAEIVHDVECVRDSFNCHLMINK